MEDQAKYIVDEVRKALDENGRFIIMELNKIFEGKSNQGIPDDENELKGVVRGYTILRRSWIWHLWKCVSGDECSISIFICHESDQIDG
ncbi:unnamed protein product [Cuscuta campestris]|uniref:Uncharacterized protein n=1 Tax=Cuscuta campestris TaxID=132261 RepID=A0A484MIZ0_9ASTE|nr:unnamed protein product [Cuscuta campestris]